MRTRSHVDGPYPAIDAAKRLLSLFSRLLLFITLSPFSHIHQSDLSHTHILFIYIFILFFLEVAGLAQKLAAKVPTVGGEKSFLTGADIGRLVGVRGNSRWLCRAVPCIFHIILDRIYNVI